MKNRKDKQGVVAQINRNIVALAGMLAECACLARGTRTAAPATRR